MPRRELKPSLTQALIAAAEEAAALTALGEHLVYVDSAWRGDAVLFATDSAHHVGVIVFGFSDEES